MPQGQNPQQIHRSNFGTSSRQFDRSGCYLVERIKFNVKIPKVSVIIPTYNRANLLSEAIQSVLDQTFKDYEIIVVDVGSTDNTREMIGRFGDKINYIYQKQCPVATTRNLGMKNSSGEYIAFLDDDDFWHKNKLEIQVKELDQNQELGFICSEADVVTLDGKLMYTLKRGWGNKENFESLFNENFIPVLTVLMRRKCYEQIGGFDENLIAAEDYDYWLRLAQVYQFKFLDAPLAKWRMTPNSTSKNIQQMFEGHLQLSRKKKIIANVPYLKVIIRRSKFCLEYAEQYKQKKQFLQSAQAYLKAVLVFPMIGFYIWPKEVRKMRFTLFHRIFRVYGLMLQSFFMAVRNPRK